jgi:YHS domain-containing protein
LCTATLCGALARRVGQLVPIGEVKLKNVFLPVALFGLVADGPRSTGSAVDPVCRMHLPPGSQYWLDHGGRTIRFCSARCRDAYAQAPESFE